MRSLISIIPAMFVLMAASGLPGCSKSWIAPMHKLEVSDAHQPGVEALSGRLSVRAVNGAINISESNTSELRVEATIKSRSAERAENATLHIEETDGVVEVYVEFPEGRQNNEGASLRLWAPPFARVEAKTSNGAIGINGVGEAVELRTSNGSITIGHEPASVYAESSNGRIELRGASERAELRTSNGSIRGGVIHGEAILRTSNGSIAAGPLLGPIDVSSSNGSIKITLDPGYEGKLVAKTNAYSGMHFKGGSNFEHEADVSTGKGYLKIIAGDAKQRTDESRVSTSNGSVTINVAGHEQG